MDLTKYTLHELEPQQNGERRWSIVKWGPVAYLTTDTTTAEHIVRLLNDDQ